MKQLSIAGLCLALAACSSQAPYQTAQTDSTLLNNNDGLLVAQQSPAPTNKLVLTDEQLHLWQNMSCGGEH